MGAKSLSPTPYAASRSLAFSSLTYKGAIFFQAHLEGADLPAAHLEGASLNGAHLEGAALGYAHLEGAILTSAHLERASLRWALLEGADLSGAQLDENTQLNDAVFGPGVFADWLDNMRFRNRNAALGDIKWRDADLTVVPWGKVQRLGDERDPDWREGADKHRRVARAYLFLRRLVACVSDRQDTPIHDPGEGLHSGE